MKRSLAALTIACMLSAGIAHADVYSVNVAGVFKIPIMGGTNYTLIAIPMSKIPVDFGVVTANDGTTITDGSASWIDGQYAASVSHVVNQTPGI